ncbi:MAG: class I SAM-dependent methyltransferase [Parcubacteria group bacterium]|nr:class I SAM-dependent methyltransferase [Parcubacteria group bacterium]
MTKKDTSWGNVAEWYDSHLSNDKDSYHNQVILPNLLRLMIIEEKERVLDLACGTGFFSQAFSKAGAYVIGIDISKELISIAQKNSLENSKFFVSSSHDLSMIKDGTIDKVVVVLAIQNIEKIRETFLECFRVLQPKGKMFIVMNHPAFRIPKGSSWGWDGTAEKQYRRIDAYLSETRAEIEMHPGGKQSEQTISFHRSLQYYFKLFTNSGFAATRLEEWISHKKSESGPRQKEEDRMRKEIPLFLFVELTKI